MLAPAGAQGLETGPAVMSAEGDAEEVAELAIEIAGPPLRMLNRADNDIGQRAQTCGEQARNRSANRILTVIAARS
jgi:hypothetical protein